MGYFEGFAVTMKQHRLFGGKRVTTEYSGGRRAKKKGESARDVGGDEKLPRPSVSTVATSSTATRTAWRSASGASSAPGSAPPSASTYVAPTTIRSTPPHPASGSGTCTRSTTCGVSTATCASKRARPRRSPSPSCSSSASPTARTRSTQGRARRRRRWRSEAAALGDWREGDEQFTSGWMRATSPSGDATFEGEVRLVQRVGPRHPCARTAPGRPRCHRSQEGEPLNHG